MPKAYFKTNVTIYYLCGLFSHMYFLKNAFFWNLFFNNEKQIRSHRRKFKTTVIAAYPRYTISTRPSATY